MRDIKIIDVADDGLVSFRWAGTEATDYDLLLQQLCLSILSDTKEYPWGRFDGGDVGNLTTYSASDTAAISAEIASRLSAIVDKMRPDHPDLRDATLEGVEHSRATGTLTVRILANTDHGVQYLRLPLGN